MRLVAGAVFVCLAAAGAEKVEILRDSFGVPHIFAQTEAGAMFGSGYAQAEDRLEELLKNYRRAEGSMAEAFGPSYFQHDYRQRLWQHREMARSRYASLPAHIRAGMEAFQRGVELYMRRHPGQVPAWAPKLEPWMQVALSRYIIWGWHEGEIASELMRAGVAPELPSYRGSNQMLVGPARTRERVPYAVIDPHLSWYGEFRFYEMRIYAGTLAASGAAIVGLPFPSLGHNRYLSIAMTTGGPDTSDVFEEAVQDGKYQFRSEWRPLKTRRETIRVKRPDGTMDERTIEFAHTHHGPIVARQGGKAYAAAIPYAEQVGLIEQMWNVFQARNLGEAKRALAMLQLMQQNIMIGTVQGDIYYVRYGRVPIRPSGCDPSRPMPGNTGQCEWQGIHPLEDLLQIHNPPQGYMQNNNTSPQWMMKNSPYTPDKYKDRFYLYNIRPGPPSQRAAMTLEQLDAAKDLSVEGMIDIAFSTEVYGADRWQERIRKAQPAPGAFVKLLLGWNRRSDADSRAALGFYLFKMALGGEASRAVTPPASLTDEAVRAALEKAEKQLHTFPDGAVYGTLFRVGREGSDRTWPVGGGSVAEAGMATPRAISFAKVGGIMVGRGGQTSTQIVILKNPPESYMVLPLGNSDHKDSPHFDDQAEKLFSQAKAKPTYFLRRAELEKHLESRMILEWNP
jgi:acyl-homoserine-lactone acylase